jgi:hypothetical protein
MFDKDRVVDVNLNHIQWNKDIDLL